jgi:hypothetical protein
MSANTSTRSADAPALLKEAPLRELIAARAVSAITAVGGDGGFVVEIRFGNEEGTPAVLANARGAARTFASLSTLAVLMARLGCPRFEVDATHYQRGRVRAAQPERSAAMKTGRLLKAKSTSSPAKRTVKK